MNRFRKKDYLSEVKKTAPTPSLRNFKELTKEDEVLRPSTGSKKRKQRQILLLSIVVPAVMVVTIFAIQSSKQEQASAAVENRIELSDQLTASELFRAFIQYNFGQQDPERLNTIKVSGSIEKEGDTQKFTLYKKRPNMALLVLTFENKGTVTFGMEAETVWRRIETIRGDPQITRVDDQTSEEIRKMGFFFHPFIQYMLDYNDLDPLFKINDRRSENNLIEVHFTGPMDGKPSKVILNGESLLIEEMHSTDASGQNTKTVYDNYTARNGFMIPFSVGYFNEDSLAQRINLEDASINIGILSEFFKMPPQL